MNLFSATPSCKLQLVKYSFIVAILIAGIPEFAVFIHNCPINQGLDDSYADFSLIVALIVKHHRDDVCMDNSRSLISQIRVDSAPGLGSMELDRLYRSRMLFQNDIEFLLSETSDIIWKSNPIFHSVYKNVRICNVKKGHTETRIC